MDDPRKEDELLNILHFTWADQRDKCVFPRVVMENEAQFSMKLTCFLISLAEYFSEFFGQLAIIGILG